MALPSFREIRERFREVSVFTATKLLSNDEFKNLPSQAIEVVPGQAGKIIRWLGAWVVLDNRGGAYDVDIGSFLQLVYMSGLPVEEASGFVRIVGPAGTPGIHSSPVPPMASFDAGEGYLYWGLTGNILNLPGVSLGIADIYNGVTNYRDGAAGNSLSVTVLYTTLPA